MFLAQGEAKPPNPLIPNATFFVELIIFVVVMWVLWRFILPPIQKVLKDRHDMVQRTIDDNKEATRLFDAAREKHREELAEARSESAKIRDEARGRGQAVLDEFRQNAQAEAASVRREGEQQLAGQREQVLGELHTRVGDLSTNLATRIVGEDVSGSPRLQSIVDDYLGRLSAKGGA